MPTLTEFVGFDGAVSIESGIMVLAPRTPSLPQLLLKPGRWTVGSAATCGFHIVEAGVQPRHALILCGQQTTVLKAWDARTWCNGHPVRGEITLHVGDKVCFGSAEFQLEFARTTDILEQLIDTPPASESDTSDVAPSSDAGRVALNEQIQNLRGDLSQGLAGRSANSSRWECEPNKLSYQAVPDPGRVQVAATMESLRARVVELERLAEAARQQTEQARQELAAARGEWARRAAEWNQERPRIEMTATEECQHDLTRISELSRELQTVRADAARLTQTWEQAASAWFEEREQRQFEREDLLTVQQQLTAELEQRQAERDELSSAHQRLMAELEYQQAERDELASAHQRLMAELEHRQAERGELLAAQQELAAELGQRQAEWSRELQNLLGEVEHLEEQGRQTTSAAAVREQELARQEQDLARQIEQLQCERRDLAKQTESLCIDRQVIDRDREELDLVKANQAREKLVLAHSWDWLQSDRRSFVDEKDKFVGEQEAWQAEKARWEHVRPQVDAEFHAAAAESESARAAIQAQQLTLTEEWARLQESTHASEVFRAETDARVAALERDHRTIESERQLLVTERQSLAAEWESVTAERDSLAAKRQLWESARLTAAADRTVDGELREQAESGDRRQESGDRILVTRGFEEVAENGAPQMLLEERWTTGVDRTDPYRDNLATPAFDLTYQRPVGNWSVSESMLTDNEDDALAPAPLPAESEIQEFDATPLPTRLWTRPLTEATSLAVFHPANDVPLSTTWTAVSPSAWLSDFVTSAVHHKVPADEQNSSAEWTSTETEPDSATDSIDTDLQTDALRADLARMFNLPELLQKPSANNELTAEVSSATDLDESAADSIETAESDGSAEFSLVEATLSSDLNASENTAAQERGSYPDERDFGVVPEVTSPVIRVPSATDDVSPYSISPNTTVEEPLSFSDDQSVDDSVTQYMQRLLGRSRGLSEQANSAVEVASHESSSTSRGPTNSPLPPTEDAASPRSISLDPVHKQDKVALRAATEQMRQVARMQTLKNVEIASWVKLKSSMKAKSALALFAFVLSTGLLFLGYRAKPGFIVLGGCAACIGALMWVDLFMAFHRARSMTKQLDAQRRHNQA